MKVTVKRQYAKAVFNWDDDCESFTFGVFGMENSEIDSILAMRLHEGVEDLRGIYEVNIS